MSTRRKTPLRALVTWLLGGVLGLASCTSAESPTGGETHFLKTCSADESCGNGLSCMCGVCTRACTDGEQCQGLPAAVCVTDPLNCSPDDPPNRCDVPCNVDADCTPVSDAHRCVANYCRTGAGPSACSTGEVEANQVLIVGDSFFAISHQITAYLEELARDGGALDVGERYRDFSTTTENALAMGGNGIQAQYERAVDEAAVEVVIMNGGGPDILVSSCTEPVTECPALVSAAAGAEQLLAQMATDGVSEIVYVFYPDPVDPAMKERMDALRVLIEPVCAASSVPCHFIDLRPTLSTAPAEYLSADGLIPTPTGSQASAGAIWETMQEECIAQ
jgi:hypothetical protein